MKEFIEKLIGRLEELNQSQIEKYTKSLCDGNLDCVYDKTDIEDTKVKTTYEIIQIVNQLEEEYNNDFCEWKQHEREIDVYFTECGQAHIFVDGNPEENNHVFCPYCGKKIKIAPYQSK